MNGFEKHGLKHISASSLNQFRECPSAWAAAKLGKAKFTAGPAAFEGKAVEAGINFLLFNPDRPVEEGVGIAQTSFQKQCVAGMVPDMESVFAVKLPLIEKRVLLGFTFIKENYGADPTAPDRGTDQHKIEIPVKLDDGSSIPAIGYLDFLYLGKQIILDTKVTGRAPSKLSLAHQIQGALYRRSMRRKYKMPFRMIFVYLLSRQKDPVIALEMDDEQEEYALEILKMTALGMDRLLRAFDDPKDLIKALPYNPDSFYWSDAENIARKQFFG
jgi:hypothetical protein